MFGGERLKRGRESKGDAVLRGLDKKIIIRTYEGRLRGEKS